MSDYAKPAIEILKLWEFQQWILNICGMFNFKEGIILQYCVGKLTLEEVIAKSNFPEVEVREVINHYQKKDWLILRT